MAGAVFPNTNIFEHKQQVFEKVDEQEIINLLNDFVYWQENNSLFSLCFI